MKWCICKSNTQDSGIFSVSIPKLSVFPLSNHRKNGEFYQNRQSQSEKGGPNPVVGQFHKQNFTFLFHSN